MTPRSVSDLLAEQPEEALQAMLEANQREAARIALEGQQIEEALAKVSRRNRGGRRTKGGSDRLTREQVFEAVERAGRAVSATEVREILASQGIDASANSVRNHLNRLVDLNGWLLRLDDGRFAVSPSRLVEFPAQATDDIPF